MTETETEPPIILAASDLSARSDRAVERAIALADALHGVAVLCHVVAPEAADADDPERLRQRVRAALPDPGADIEIMLASGPVPEAIARQAAAIGPQLIVAGVARYNSLGDYFTGTTVDHLVHHARAPVLVVKQRAHRRYDRVLVAVDFSECSAAALVQATRLFPTAELHLVHAYHVPYEGWQKSDYIKDATRSEQEGLLSDFLDRAGLSEDQRSRIATHLEYGDVAEAVRRAIAQTDPALLVMGTHGRGALAHAAMGSIASSLLRWVDCDCLLVKG